MGALSLNRVGGVSLIVGPVLAIVFFLLQPAGLLIDPVEPSDKVGAVTAYASNAELTRLTSMLIALGLVAMFFGYTVVWSDLRDSGRPDVLVRYGILFLLIGVTAWILVQGIHIVLASTNLQSPESIGGRLPSTRWARALP
jgi:hypothetical protein